MSSLYWRCTLGSSDKPAPSDEASDPRPQSLPVSFLFLLLPLQFQPGLYRRHPQGTYRLYLRPPNLVFPPYLTRSSEPNQSSLPSLSRLSPSALCLSPSPLSILLLLSTHQTIAPQPLRLFRAHNDQPCLLVGRRQAHRQASSRPKRSPARLQGWLLRQYVQGYVSTLPASPCRNNGESVLSPSCSEIARSGRGSSSCLLGFSLDGMGIRMGCR
jgi:hypothetical protein